ncbi:cupin-like domain-containing protein [Streptomyces nitrosporeus]|uniref:cupin-like domain-containing protein n=1 Tax=Streptomyces nitrosporeus TaxID=28894 RepID=UPI00167D1447|nr:cupin-like domain-containing protein [Streptomyces nitrosporeus]
MFKLADLISPLALADFFTGPWPDQAWSRPQSPTLAAHFEQIPELASAHMVLSSAASVGVFIGEGNVQMVPGGQAAISHYEAGRTCFIRSDRIPRLAEYTKQFTADLGLPEGSMHSEIFCSKGSSGAAMHSDYDINFALLVRGHKRWRVAPNKHIRNQVGQCFPDGHEKPDSIGIRLADRVPFPATMPEDAQVIDVSAGGLVFVPRGWWHQTESSGSCLQVNFVIKRFMWLTILSRAIRNVLLEDPNWRAYALGIFAQDGREERAMKSFAALLPRLKDSLNDMLDGDSERAAQRIIELSGLKPAGLDP